MKFVYTKPLSFKILICIYLILLVIIVPYLLKYKTYSKIRLKGIINNNQIIIPTEISDISNIKKSEKISLDNEKNLNFKIDNFSEVYNDGNINLQDITISCDVKNKIENEIINITFYYDKDYVYKKILKGAFK